MLNTLTWVICMFFLPGQQIQGGEPGHGVSSDEGEDDGTRWVLRGAMMAGWKVLYRPLSGCWQAKRSLN